MVETPLYVDYGCVWPDRIYSSSTLDLSIKSAVRFDNGINFSFPDSSNAIFFPIHQSVFACRSQNFEVKECLDGIVQQSCTIWRIPE